jgi:uncharacterized damage-inducible protein DinB
MARNNAWSNLRLYRACLTLTDEAFAERRVSSSHRYSSR